MPTHPPPQSIEVRRLDLTTPSLWGWDAAEEQVKSAIFIGHTGSSHLIIVQESCVSHERRISLSVFEGEEKRRNTCFLLNW
jgi:hypothetical protein